METFAALLAIYAGNSPVPGEFPTQRPVTRSFDVLFDLRLNKRLSNNGEACDLRRYRVHYDVTVMMTYSISGIVQCWFFLLSTIPLWRHRNDDLQYIRNCPMLFFSFIDYPLQVPVSSHTGTGTVGDQRMC